MQDLPVSLHAPASSSHNASPPPPKAFLRPPSRKKSGTVGGRGIQRTGPLRTVLSAVVLLPLMLISQERSEVPHTMPWGVKGTLSHGYFLSKGDTVLSGDWRFRASQVDTTDPSIVHGLELRGQCDQGLKTGVWTYSAQDLRTGDRPIVRDHQVVWSATGMEHMVNASFDAGSATGTWQMIERHIGQAGPTDTTSYLQASFSKGLPTGTLHGRIGETSFQGAFAQGGLLHGEWHFEHRMPGGRTVMEFRRYEEGILREHLFEQQGLTVTLQHPGLGLSMASDAMDLKEVGINKDYFELLAFTGNRDSSTEEPPGLSSLPVDSLASRSSALLLHGLTALTAHNKRNIWATPCGSEPPAPGLVRMRHFPYSDQEQLARVNAIEAFRECQELVTRFFSDPLTDLARHAYEDVEALHAVMMIHQENIGKLGKVMTVLEHPMSAYTDRRILLPWLIPSLEHPSSVSYWFKDTSRNRDHAFPHLPTDAPATAMALEEHLTATRKDLLSIRHKVDLILDRYKGQSLLVEKEEKLVRKRDSLLSLYGNTAGKDDFNPYHERLASGMREMVLTRFKEYAGLDQERKLDHIDGLLACFNEGLDVYQKQLRTPVRIARIDELYTRTIWNPHTFTYMDERIKERIYRAYENVLLPLVMDEMATHVECGKMMNKQQNMVKLYQRMLELREQDTRDIDRQLRRVTDPEDLMRILGLDLNLG